MAQMECVSASDPAGMHVHAASCRRSNCSSSADHRMFSIVVVFECVCMLHGIRYPVLFHLVGPRTGDCMSVSLSCPDGNFNTDWATSLQGVGSWIKLTFASSNINKLVIQHRVCSCEWNQLIRLEFSDGICYDSYVCLSFLWLWCFCSVLICWISPDRFNMLSDRRRAHVHGVFLSSFDCFVLCETCCMFPFENLSRFFMNRAITSHMKLPPSRSFLLRCPHPLLVVPL